MKLPFLTTRCQYQCQIAILNQQQCEIVYLHHQRSVSMGNYNSYHQISVAMRSCPSSPLDVSSNVKLPFLTTRCQQQCEIAVLDHQMLVAMCKYPSSLLHVSSNVKLPFVTTRCQQQCEITIPENMMSVAMGKYHS